MTSTAEKYLRAARSSHLQMSYVEPGDIDMLIAAGTLTDGIGPSLLRLRAERDSISGMPNSRLLSRALTSMAGTRMLLIRYGSQNSNYPEDAVELRGIVDNVLDLFLEPGCPTCGGTGKTGVYGSPQSMCSTCGGSTRRKLMWPTEESEALAYWLAAQMEDKMAQSLRRISVLLRQG